MFKPSLSLTRSIKVSCLSWFLLKSLVPWQIPGYLYRDRTPARLDILCTVINFQPSKNLVPRYTSCSIGSIPWWQKRTPYPPCTVTIYRLKKRDNCPVRCRVTQPTFIAVPLAERVFHPDNKQFSSIQVSNKTTDHIIPRDFRCSTFFILTVNQAKRNNLFTTTRNLFK